MRSIRPAQPVVVMTVAAMLAACGSATDTSTEQEQKTEVRQAYCVDKDNKIVDDSNCDTGNNNNQHSGGGMGGAGFFLAPLILGNLGGGFRTGDRLPDSTPRVNPNDADARTKAGLPSTGSGTKTVTTSGGGTKGGLGSGSANGKSSSSAGGGS